MGNRFQLVVNNVEWLNKYTFVGLTYLDCKPSNALLFICITQMALFLFADTTPNVDDEKSKLKNCGCFFSNLFASAADC